MPTGTTYLRDSRAISHEAGPNPCQSKARKSPILSNQASQHYPNYSSAQQDQDSLEDMVKGSEHGLCSHEQRLKAIHHTIIQNFHGVPGFKLDLSNDTRQSKSMNESGKERNPSSSGHHALPSTMATHGHHGHQKNMNPDSLFPQHEAKSLIAAAAIR